MNLNDPFSHLSIWRAASDVGMSGELGRCACGLVIWKLVLIKQAQALGCVASCLQRIVGCTFSWAVLYPIPPCRWNIPIELLGRLWRSYSQATVENRSMWRKKRGLKSVTKRVCLIMISAALLVFDPTWYATDRKRLVRGWKIASQLTPINWIRQQAGENDESKGASSRRRAGVVTVNDKLPVKIVKLRLMNVLCSLVFPFIKMSDVRCSVMRCSELKNN